MKTRFKKRKLTFSSRFLGAAILILAAILALFHFVLLSGMFELKNIKVVSQADIDEEEIKQIIDKQLNKKFFRWLSIKPLFLISPAKISNEILAKYPSIKRANVQRKFPHSLVLTIKKRRAVGIWCQPKKDFCFLFDESRIIFEKIKKQQINEELILVFSDDKDKKLGNEVLAPLTFSQILEIEQSLKEIDLTAESFWLTILPLKELRVKLKKGWEIYFNLDKDVKLALSQLRLVLKEEIPKQNWGNLEYIDLRFTKIYYK